MARREPNFEASTGRTNGGASPNRTVIGAILLLALVAGIFIYRGCGQLSALERQNVQVTETLMKVVQRLEQVEEQSGQALDRAQEAERSALEAARGRDAADSARRKAERDRAEARRTAEAAQEETRTARKETRAAREEARTAREEAERIRAERERELNRLHKVLSGIVETRRTALGVVMNLGSEAVEFDFDKATLRPENRELLSRIAGVLLTSKRYRVQIHGHTDDIGSSEYNERLSERRADAVRNYLVDAGIDPAIISIKGHGKAAPLVPGTTAQARAKNRRVEIGIIDTAISYGPVASEP